MTLFSCSVLSKSSTNIISAFRVLGPVLSPSLSRLHGLRRIRLILSLTDSMYSLYAFTIIKYIFIHIYINYFI